MDRLRKLRKERNVTQQELADDMLVTTRTLGRYESGEREPRLPIAVSYTHLTLPTKA